jgi:Cellulase (glycosyl hydrolase family 5)
MSARQSRARAPRNGRAASRHPSQSKEDAFVRHRILLAVLTCLAVLVPVVSASASSRQFTTIEAPAELLNGAPGPALDQIQSLGATAVRIQLSWDQLAPDPQSRQAPSFNATDPNAYPAANWSRYDAAIDGARARGLKVLLTVTGAAPRWATAHKTDGLTSPSATDFGKFATAVGRRYGGQVAVWSIWNEPNLGKMLKPIKGLASAKIYRQLYLKAYSGLRQARVGAPILIGELAPIHNSLPDQGTIAPLRFLRAVLCLDAHYRRVGRGCAQVPTQGFAMHPYTTAFGPRYAPPDADDVTIGVLGRLTSALDRAAHAGALPHGLPVYVTEFGVQSFPDHVIGVSLPLQSDYRSIAEYIAYRNGRVRSFSQYLLRDDVTSGAHSSFQSGLFLFKGYKPKPSYEGFRLPLVVIGGRHGRVTLWGLVRPAHGRAGSLTIQYEDRGHGWRTLATQRYGAGGYWQRPAGTRSGRAFRVLWTAPDGTAHTGPATIAR